MTDNKYPDVKESIFKKLITWFYSQSIYNKSSLATALGVSGQSVARWLTRVCIPDTALWFKLCEIMNISIVEFLGLDKNAMLSQTESTLINNYKNDLSFKSFIDHYFSDENFKRTIDSLAVLTK